jgi:hypothetical protein
VSRAKKPPRQLFPKTKSPTKEDREIAFRHLRPGSKPVGPEGKWLQTGEGFVVDSLMSLAELVARVRLIGHIDGFAAGRSAGFRSGEATTIERGVQACSKVEDDCARAMRKAPNDETCVDWGHRRKTARRCREAIEALSDRDPSMKARSDP